MPPISQLDTPPSSPKSPPRKKPKFSLKLKSKTKPDERESSAKEKVYGIFSSPPQDDGADSCGTTEPLPTPPPHAGLLNHGNICYANAVLQVLRHCPGFVDSVASTRHCLQALDESEQASAQTANTNDGVNGKLSSLVCNLDMLLCAMETTECDYHITKEDSEYLEHRRGRIVLATDPVHFMDSFREVNPTFHGHLQHDAQEFLCALLVNIQDAIKHVNKVLKEKENTQNMENLAGFKKPARKTRFKGTSERKSHLTNTKQIDDDKEESEMFDFIGEMFQGRLLIQTRCLTCEGTKKRYEDFQDVSVPVEKENPAIDPEKLHHFSPAPKSEKIANKPTLSRAISQFAAVESLYGDNKYFCESCCTHNEAQITTYFDVLPEVFTVHFKRFKASSYSGFASGWVTKITSNLETPVHLSLKQWCSQACRYRDSAYELFGIVMHSGTGSCSGHYQAYVKVMGYDSCDGNNNENQRNDLQTDAMVEADANSESMQSSTGGDMGTQFSHNQASGSLNDTRSVKGFPDGRPTNQFDDECDNGQTTSSENPSSSVEKPKPTCTSGIAKFFHKSVKDSLKSTKERHSNGQPSSSNTNMCGQHGSSTEKEDQTIRDSVKKIHAFEYQAQRTKSSANRRLDYQDRSSGNDSDFGVEQNGCQGVTESEENMSGNIREDVNDSTSGEGDKTKDQQSEWVHFDDSDVYTLQESDVTSVLSLADSSFTSPYLLFYKRVRSE